MKALLALLLLCSLAFSQFIVNEVFPNDSCRPHADAGALYIPDKCYVNPQGQGSKMIMDTQRTTFTLQGNCNEKCQECQVAVRFNATCNKLGSNSMSWRYGVEGALGPTGFFLRAYSDPACTEEKEAGPIGFRSSKWCGAGDDEFLTFQWNRGLNGLEILHSRESCENTPFKRRFFALDTCHPFVEGGDLFVKPYHKF